MKVLESLKKDDLKALLWDLRTYADMTKKLGNRGAKLFKKTISGQEDFVVEYFSSLWEDEAFSQAQIVFERSFGKKPEKTDITFLPREDIKWGMKVYVDDNMVDLSYSKVEKLLQK